MSAGLRVCAAAFLAASAFGCGQAPDRGGEPPSPVEAIRVQVSYPRQDATSTVLDNGLRLVLIENHATPLVASIAVVGAGSRYENVETSGASHFLEHLLFNGTERRTQEQLYDEVDLIGGYNNATTGRDQTTFMMLVPSEHAARGLDIQADMLFGSTLPQEKFEKERGIIVEEIGKDNDRAETFAESAFEQALYKDTPYAQPVIGSVGSIRAMDRDRVFAYYKNRYVPNNMTLLVIGDFQAGAMLDLVKGTYGNVLPRAVAGEEPAPPHPIERDVIQVRRGPTERAHLYIGFEAPPLGSADYPAFAALAALLGQGDNSRLSQALRAGPTPRVYEVSASIDASREFSRFVVRAVCPPEADLGAILETVLTQMKQFMTLPPAPQELRRIVTEMRVGELARKEQLHYYGLYAAPFLANADYEFLRDYTARLEQVTPADVERVARASFSDLHYVASALVPEKSAEGSATVSATGGPWPAIELPNGLEVLVRSDPASQVFAAHLLARDRALREPAGRDGIADVLHHAILRGTVVHRGRELADALQAIGATLKAHDDPSIPYDDYYTTPAYSFIRLETADEYAEEALRLLTEIVRQPTLRDEDILAARDELAARAEESAGQTGAVARRLYLETLWPGHPYGRNPSGNAGTLRSITPEEVRSFHETYFAPGNLVLAVRTSMPEEAIEQIVRSLWNDARNPRGFQKVELPPGPPTSGAERRETTGKQQSVVSLGRVLGPVPVEDRAPLLVLASIASNELAFELRERRGLAYSVGIDANVEGPIGSISARIGTSPQNIQEARAGLRDALGDLASRDYGEDEVVRVKNKLLGQRLMRRMTRINQAYFASLGELSWNDPSSDAALTDALRLVTASAVSRAATRYFGPGDALVEVVVE